MLPRSDDPKVGGVGQEAQEWSKWFSFHIKILCEYSILNKASAIMCTRFYLQRPDGQAGRYIFFSCMCGKCPAIMNRRIMSTFGTSGCGTTPWDENSGAPNECITGLNGECIDSMHCALTCPPPPRNYTSIIHPSASESHYH